MTDKHQITFKDSLLQQYPRMQNLFKSVPCGNRAQALMAMGEAFAYMVDPNCEDLNALFYLAEAVRRGCLQKGNFSIDNTAAPTEDPLPTQINTTMPTLDEAGDMSVADFLNS